MVCTKLLFLCADSRFAKPRYSLKKVLIVAVRSGGCGALNRGLQNLGAPCKGMDCHFLHCAKSNQKAHGAKPHISQLKGKRQQKGRKNQTEGGRNPKQQRRQYEYTRTKSPCAKVHIYSILCVYGESRNRILNA